MARRKAKPPSPPRAPKDLPMWARVLALALSKTLLAVLLKLLAAAAAWLELPFLF